MQLIQDSQSVWIKISSKGLVTLPKKMRQELGLKDGDMAKATLSNNKIIIEPLEEPYEGRLFTDEQIAEWITEDKLTDEQIKRYKKDNDEFWGDTE